MRKKEKWALAAALILISIGVITTAISQRPVQKETDNAEENGISYFTSWTSEKPITSGTNISRYFQEGEKMTVTFDHRYKNEYADAIPDLLPPINFTIIGPDGAKAIFWYWYTTYTNPYDTSGTPSIIPSEMEVGKIEGLTYLNTSATKFVAKTLESGNYTLVFTSKYTELNYMEFTKIISYTEYPYPYIWPYGVGFIVIGTILPIWAIRSSKQRKLRKGFKNKRAIR